MDTGWGVYVNGKFTYQVYPDREGAELCACVWHCPGMAGESRKEREDVFKARCVKIVPVAVIPSAPVVWTK